MTINFDDDYNFDDEWIRLETPIELKQLSVDGISETEFFSQGVHLMTNQEQYDWYDKRICGTLRINPDFLRL